MVEKLGKNKVHDNGTVSLPRNVIDELEITKGEDILGFKKSEEDEIEICKVEVDY